jgi:hypothetical protein
VVCSDNLYGLLDLEADFIPGFVLSVDLSCSEEFMLASDRSIILDSSYILPTHSNILSDSR